MTNYSNDIAVNAIATNDAVVNEVTQNNTNQKSGFSLNADGTYTPHTPDGQPGTPVKAGVTVNDGAATSVLAHAAVLEDGKQADLHVLVQGLGHVQLKAAADVLAQRRTAWELGALKSSNAELIALLADCLGFYLHLIKFDDARKKFHAIYKEANLQSTKGTELMTKIVRYVFGEKAAKRTFAYAKVLSVAWEEKVSPEMLADFVASRGGIEEVRRSSGKSNEKRKMRDESIEKASASLKIVKPLAEKVVPPKTLKVEGTTNFVAAIARREADGTLSIVHVSTNATLIERLLENASKDVVKSEATSDTEAYVANRQSNANHASNQ
jgi:transcriptional regulator